MAGMSTAGFAGLVAGEDWHYVGEAGEPAFENSWANRGAGYTKAAFRRREAGVIDLAGHLATGGSGALTIFTLPEDYRPTAATFVQCIWSSGGDFDKSAWIDVATNGEVRPIGAGTANWVIVLGQFFLNPPDVAA